MKNIFVVPTTDATRLMRMFDHDRDELELSLQCCGWQYGVHVNITSYEEIKEGDWCIDLDTNNIFKIGNWVTDRAVKIILTTDFRLAPDVQKIDDAFLEWFIKNPTCEFVEIESWETKGEWDLDYKIIIPKEKPKQEEPKKRGYICPHTKVQCDDECCVSAEDCHIVSQISVLEKPEQEAEGKYFADNADSIIVMKQETLEEVAKRLASTTDEFNMFVAGAKWQAERMYSEEDVLKLLNKFSHRDGMDKEENLTLIWFEQFKKK
jgi:hypothetical protein